MTVARENRLLAGQLSRHFPGGVPDELAGFLADVDLAYRQADEELQQRNEELRLSLRASGIGTFCVGADGATVWEGYPHPLSGTSGRIAGRDEEMLVLLPDAERAAVRAALRRAAASGEDVQLRVAAGDRTVLVRGRRPAHGATAVRGLCADITGEVRAAAEEGSRRHRLEAHGAVLIRLAHRLADPGDDLGGALQLVSEAAGRAVEVERTSVWLCGPEELRCLDYYLRSTGEHGAGEVIARRELAHYLASIADQRVVVADDARRDPRYIELWDGYLVRHGVTSCLDAPVRLGGELVAFVCHDHVGPPRRWTPDEQAFAASVADLVALVLEGRRRRDAEAALEKQRAFLRQVIDLSPNLIFAKDREGRFTLVNQALADVYGTTVEALEGRREADFNHNADEVAWFHRQDLEVIDTRAERVIPEETITDAAGRRRVLHTVKRALVEADGHAVQVLGVASDITERKRAEERRVELEASLRQAQRLESIGLLAGGLAHDFNNLLTPILALAQHIQHAVPYGDPVREDARDILRAASQARDIIAQLMALGGRQLLQVRPVDLHELLAATQRFLGRLLPESISIVLALAAEPVVALADPAQLDQVLINLAANARDAMPGGGTLTIGTACAGEVVRVTVTDTGRGIPPDVVPRIFDPFFTTKEIGRGSGLGLATVYGIVQQHRGHIEVQSHEGRGARFVITLPRAAGRPSVAPAAPEPASGGETVLVVEDEDLVRKLVVRVLKQAGFTVLAACSAAAALEVAAAHTGRIDLLLTDVVMPAGDGVALSRQLLAERPDSKVLFMSGHVRDILGQHGVVDERTPILMKPFVPADLTAAVRRVLDR